MKHGFALLFALALAIPAAAQRRVDVILDAEGVHRTGKTVFEPNTTRYEPQFDNGGGVGLGINWFFGKRTSLELKAAVLESHLRPRRTGSDFVAVGDLGEAQIYPITAILQWHMLEGTAIRPYLGAGAGYMILKNIDRQTLGLNGVAFGNPVGLVVDGGIEIWVSKRLSVIGDARYTPIESRSKVRFVGSPATAEINVKPLIISTGIAYRF